MTKKITTEDVYTKEVGDLYEKASISNNPTSREYILDLVAEYVNQDSLILDVGCANGGVSRKLLEKTNCNIKGVELVKLLVDMGNKENKKLKFDDKFQIYQGSMTEIPFENNTFDFVLANDVIGLVYDLDTAFRECYRVLKPGGKILVYASYGSDKLSESEEKFFIESLAISENGFNLDYAKNNISKYFNIIKEETIGSQFTQYNVEKDQEKSQAAADLLKTARLLTWPEKYKKEYGEQVYQIVLAEVQWSVYILLGKIIPTILIAQKPNK